MIATDVIRDTVSVTEIALKLTTLEGRIGKELKGPCPMCGGNDRFSVFKDGKGWMCRHCNPKGGGVIELVKLAYNLDFIGACKFLGFEGDKRPPQRERVLPTKPARSSYDWQTEEWQREQKNYVTACANAIMGSAGQSYLGLRGITSRQIKRYALGYDAGKNAITIPYISKNRELTAVKFRRIDPECDPKKRFWQLEGSQQVVFGAQHSGRSPRAILCEGELNAISLDSALSGSFDVLSFGGHLMHENAIAVGKGYASGIVWCDELDKAQAIADGIPGFRAWQSVALDDGEKGDPNDILVVHGPEILRQLIERVAA